MYKLHNDQDDAYQFEPREGQRGLLCSNKAPSRCPSLGFNSDTSEDKALKCLARILVEAFLETKYENRKRTSR